MNDDTYPPTGLPEGIFDLRSRAEMPSLRDPLVAEAALEAALDEEDRVRGGLSILVCDPDGLLLQPIFIQDVPPDADAAERQHAIAWACDICHMVQEDATLSLVLSLVRESGPVTDVDRAWHQSALDECARATVTLLSMHVTTLAGSELLPAASRAA